MSFDGIFTHAMVNELNEQLISGRVARISQPFPNEIILTIRANRKNYPLLLSANPNYARVQITEIPFSNPPVPTNFTMTLRKYLDGAKLIEIKQLENDRVVYFSFLNRNELGDQTPLQLSIEIMGRYSNVILIDQKENKILDTIKHIGMDQDRYRTLLPGATYRQPPKQDKINPFDDPDKKYIELVHEYPNRDVLSKKIVGTYQGFARDTALELADILHQESPDLEAGMDLFMGQIAHPNAAIIKKGKKTAFTIFKHDEADIKKKFSTLSEMLDAYYKDKATLDRVEQQGAALIKLVKNELKKNRKKFKKLKREMNDTQKADTFKVKGEILTTYLFKLKRGMTQIELPNYYENNKPVKISLSPNSTPSQNAQKYFKRYQKLKNAVKYISHQIELTQTEIDYFERIQAQIELAEPQDLPDIKLELQEQGYMKKQKSKKHKKRRIKVSRPESFTSSNGSRILVGKNNLQNDRLTLKTAHKDYYWFHVKNFPGSHVILENNRPDDQDLYEAAMLAAYFSKARMSANVPVDYVQVKRIHKPNGAKPGFVIYTGQKTLFVTPEEKLVNELRSK